MAGRDSLEMAQADAVVDTMNELVNLFSKIIVPELLKPSENKVNI